jgi:magnesium transporter
MITNYQYIDNKLTEVTEMTSGCWVNIYPPFDYNAIKEIAEKLNVDIENFTDALDIDEQSRYEEDDDTKFILLNTPIRNEKLVNNTRASFITIPISIVIKDNIVITTSLYKNPVIDSIISKSSRKPLFQDIQSLVLNIFDRNTDFFHYYLKQINLRFNDFEKIIDTQATNKDFVTILQLQKSLIYFETNLRSNNLMMVKMKRTNFLDTREVEEYDDFFDEVIIENQQAIEMTEVYSRILDSSMQTISSIISNNVNSIVKRLTGATIILMIPSIISGLWGMNVPVPFGHSAYGFGIISIVTISLIGAIVYLFYKKRWI